MALKPLRPCRHPGCPDLTREGWCPDHKPKPAQRRESADWHGWYSLPVWVHDLRPMQLLREPWCRECAKQGIRTRATVVDHIAPHKGSWSLFTDPGNLQSLCKHHHDQKTMRELNEVRRNGADFATDDSGKLRPRPGASAPAPMGAGPPAHRRKSAGF